MEDAWRFFRPPLAPNLYICIPAGDPEVYEQEGVSRDIEKLRDFVVQGEILTYFVVISFDALRKEQPGGKSHATEAILRQVTNAFQRLRLVTKFKSGKDVLPVIQHCRVVGHTKSLPKRDQSSISIQRKPFGIGDPESTASIDGSSVGGSLSASAEPSRGVTPVPPDVSELSDSLIGDQEAEDEAYASLSKMGRKLPTSPVVALDPNVATMLPNGDLYYKLTTRVNLADKFIGSSITMSVEVMLKDEPMDVGTLLSRLVPKDPSNLAPVLTAYTMFNLTDPLKVGFSTCSTHMDHFITVTLENLINQPLIIGDASLHFALTEISRRPAVEMDKLFKAEILKHEPLPLTLTPQEVFSFVIKVDACPLGTSEEVGTSRRHVHPTLLLTWRIDSLPTFLVSQFSIPFPTPHAEQLLLTVSVPYMPLVVNTAFNMQVSLTNLASYPRSLALELPLPDIKSLWQEGVSISDRETLSAEDELLGELIKARHREATILCVEKHVHLGRAEPKGELTANVRCIAAQSGIFHLDGIRVFDKHNREDIRSYLIEAPIELTVIPSLAASYSNESSMEHAHSGLALSTLSPSEGSRADSGSEPSELTELELS